MGIPRFTLRDMFIATTLIAVGVGVATFTIHYANVHSTEWACSVGAFSSCLAVRLP